MSNAESQPSPQTFSEDPARRRSRRLVIWLLILAPAVFTAAAYLSTLVLHSTHAAVEVQLSMVTLVGTIVALVAARTVVHHYEKWRHPVRQLIEKIQLVRDGRMPIEELSRVEGALAPLSPVLQDILRELRRQRAHFDELEGEMSQRVARRTESLERQIGSLRQQAVRDPLTGLYNRRILDQCLSMLVERARKNEQDLCVLAMDLDNFKLLNDTCGHAAGDELLRNIGQLIRCSVRDQDMGFRCGGDEFMIVVPAAGAEVGRQFAARLGILVDSLARVLKVSRPVRASIGVTVLSAHPLATPDQLLDAADRQLYDVKASHKQAERRPAA